MGFFDLFKGKTSPSDRFVSERGFVENKKKQKKMVPQTMQELRKIGVTEDKELKLEYFFYTNTPDKAKIFSQEIAKLGYAVEYSKSASTNDFVITGWTTKMKMNNSVVESWSEKMCDLGYKFDCDFDGWGTSPDQ